jgi:hypothetical protein
MNNQTPTSIRVIRYIASAALGLGLAIGSAAVANAEPEWDIGAYDNCMASLPTILTPAQYAAAERDCCLKSGGVHDMWKCEAPGAEQNGRNPLSGDAPTHVIQPVPLPGQGGPVVNPGSNGVS